MQQSINLQEQTVESLKALAYDCIMERDRHQNNLNLINQELNLRSQQPQPNIPPPPEQN